MYGSEKVKELYCHILMVLYISQIQYHSASPVGP